MGKEGKSKKKEARFRFYNLHCECVRRNGDYVKQYKKIKKIRSKKARELKIILLASDWDLRVSDLPDPEERPLLNQVKNLKPKSPVYLPGDYNPDPLKDKAMVTFGFNYMYDFKKKNFQNFKGVLFLVYFPEEDSTNPRLSAINVRHSKKDILEGFEEWIDYHLSLRNKHGLKQESRRDRKQLELWFDYLKVYDMKESGMKYSEIGRKIWPNQKGQVWRKVKDYYIKAQDLINNPPLCKMLNERWEARKRVQ